MIIIVFILFLIFKQRSKSFFFVFSLFFVIAFSTETLKNKFRVQKYFLEIVIIKISKNQKLTRIDKFIKKKTNGFLFNFEIKILLYI